MCRQAHRDHQEEEQRGHQDHAVSGEMCILGHVWFLKKFQKKKKRHYKPPSVNWLKTNKNDDSEKKKKSGRWPLELFNWFGGSGGLVDDCGYFKMA